jgi:putative pyruvate formate lyase activating enzyme
MDRIVTSDGSRPLSRRQFVIRVGGGLLFVVMGPTLLGCRARPPGHPRTAPGGAKRPDEIEAARPPPWEPVYLALHRSGELAKRAERLWQRMEACDLCPRECGTDRLDGDRGVCGASSTLVVASAHPHFGEEDELVGEGGSGTVFMSHCNLRCVFCINWEISHGGEGSKSSLSDLADMMLGLQRRGCENINIVTPTHYTPHVLKGLDIAAGRGLKLPLVWNTSSWEKMDVLEQLEGVVDIYLPDIKYSDPKVAGRLSSGADSYPQVARAAVMEMFRQVGNLERSPEGIARKGLIIRHLVMPNDASGTAGVLAWIGANLPKETYVNLMSQYTPHYKAPSYPEIDRRITREEYQAAIDAAQLAGLTNVHLQGR